jgi:hypothetical protein
MQGNRHMRPGSTGRPGRLLTRCTRLRKRPQRAAGPTAPRCSWALRARAQPTLNISSRATAGRKGRQAPGSGSYHSQLHTSRRGASGGGGGAACGVRPETAPHTSASAGTHLPAPRGWQCAGAPARAAAWRCPGRRPARPAAAASCSRGCRAPPPRRARCRPASGAAACAPERRRPRRAAAPGRGGGGGGGWGCASAAAAAPRGAGRAARRT